MQALQKKQKTWVLLLLGALLGLAAFLCLYGTAPLDPANDAWIWYGYDETDIPPALRRVAGVPQQQLAVPAGPGPMPGLPGGTGVNISFTDSLPGCRCCLSCWPRCCQRSSSGSGCMSWPPLFCRAWPRRWCWGCSCTICCRLRPGTALFAFSPIMIERAFRHVALSSHYIVLFALYAYLRGRREQRCFMPVFWLLAALGVGITPYFLPMVAIFALLRRWKTPCTPANCWPPAGCFWAPARPGMRRAWCWVR